MMAPARTNVRIVHVFPTATGIPEPVLVKSRLHALMNAIMLENSDATAAVTTKHAASLMPMPAWSLMPRLLVVEERLSAPAEIV
jgi:hypothetical protein